MTITAAENVVPYMLWQNEFVEHHKEDDYDSGDRHDREHQKLLCVEKRCFSDVRVNRKSNLDFPHHDILIVGEGYFENWKQKDQVGAPVVLASVDLV